MVAILASWPVLRVPHIGGWSNHVLVMPMTWNSLPDFIRDPTSSTDCLGVYLKRTGSRVTSESSALGVLNDYALYKSTRSLTHSPYLPAPFLHPYP